MSDNIEKADLKKIETLEELQNHKRKINAEMDVLSTNITNSARDLVRQGAKVAAAGVAAAIISKVIGTLIVNRKESKRSASPVPANEQTAFATAAPAAEGNATQGSEDEGTSVQSMIRTAIIWLDVIMKGIETAKVLMNEFRPDEGVNSEDVPENSEGSPKAEQAKQDT